MPVKPRKTRRTSEKIKFEDEDFRPPRIPKVLRSESKKKKEAFDEIDNEPVYTDDYDNTILSTEY